MRIMFYVIVSIRRTIDAVHREIDQSVVICAANTYTSYVI
jgi:hypothetical protein